MAYGPTRYLYNNLLQSATTITLTTMAYGILSGAEKMSGSGSALMYAVGNYTGTTNKIFTVQIDAQGTGAIGNATFRWRTNETALGSWEATGVTTSATPIAIGSEGVYIAWVALSGSSDTPLVVYDEWQFDALSHFSPVYLYDFNPLTYYRSLNITLPQTITVDLGSAQAITACLLYDTNITSVATCTLSGNTINAWGAPAYTQAITPEEVLYLNETYRYWQISITDAVNPDNFIEICHLYLGTYMSLTGNGFWGSSQRRNYTTQQERNLAGLETTYLHRKQREYNLQYGIARQADLTSLLTMRDALISETDRNINPVFLHVFSDETDDLLLANWSNMLAFDTTYHSNQVYQYTLNFQEKVNGKVRA